MNNKILVIDDEKDILNDYRLILSDQSDRDTEQQKLALEKELFGTTSQSTTFQENWEVHTALQGEQGYRLAKEHFENDEPFALAFIDIRMPPGWDGLQTAQKIRELDPNIELVIVTAYSDNDRKDIVQSVGKPERLLYIKKPFDPDEIRQLALALTQKWNLERKSERHQKYLEQLLSAVKRLKTTSITSIREVLHAILNEVLNFVDAQKGFIAKIEHENVSIEIASQDPNTPETQRLLKEISLKLHQIKSITWVKQTMIIPLQDVSGNIFVLVSDLKPPVDDEKYELLKILLTTASEVLENIKKQEQYLKNERIATIGQIAAGIIHEINNPLSAIFGAADMSSLQTEKFNMLLSEYQNTFGSGDCQPELKTRFEAFVSDLKTANINAHMTKYYQVIQSGIGQIRGLMDNIRSFSKDGNQFQPALQNISDALENTLLLAQNTLKHGIRIHKDWEKTLLARCDINSLKQVFLNLILNAIQAMEGNGDIWISGKRDNGNIHVSIKDTGPGIPEEMKEKIFDAFYSTKSEGTGLGLSIVKGIIEKHNGKLWVESEPGKGTNFHIQIPVK